MSTSSTLHDLLWDCAVGGEWWEPEGRPEVPADWVRDLVVTGRAGNRDVHARGVRIRGVTLVGALDFEHATLETPLLLADVDTADPINLERATGTWISITDSRVASISAQQLGLNHSLVLTGTHVDGPVRLRAAHIIGDIILSGFEAEGEVDLVGATIGGNLQCSNGKFRNQGGKALVADSVEVGGSVFLRAGFEAEGEVNLVGATIGGNLECDSGTFHNQDGTALNGQLLTVRQRLRWFDVSEVAGTVDLSSAHVGDLVDDPGSWEHPEMKYVLEGLTVDRFTGPSWSWRQRKAWLTGKQEPNRPGPYEVVARWYRSVGSDHDARRIAIAKQKARTATLTPWWRRLPHRTWGLFAGYGYQPLRAVAVLTLVWLWGVWVFSPGRMDPTETPPVYAFYRWVYSADTVIPLVDLKQAAQWAPADTLGLVTMWALIAAGWILSLALIAAISGLYTKD